MIIQEARTVVVPAIDSTDVFHFVDQLDPTRMNKINVIKVVRSEWGIGLKEAKDLVEGVWRALDNMQCLVDAPWRGKTIEHIEPHREFIRNNADTVTDHDVAIEEEREGDDLPW